MNAPQNNQGDEEVSIAGVVAVDIGMEIFKRAGDSITSWILNKAFGAKVIVVGPTGSGKTKFSDYLAYGILEPELYHVSDTDSSKSGQFSISEGSRKKMQMRVKNSVTLPGQWSPKIQAEKCKSERADVIVVVLNCLKPNAPEGDLGQVERDQYSFDWFQSFCEALADLNMKNKDWMNDVRSFIVLLNKRDKVNPSQYKTISKDVRATMKAALNATLGFERLKGFRVMPCVSVSTEEYKSTLIDAAVRRIIKDVS